MLESGLSLTMLDDDASFDVITDVPSVMAHHFSTRKSNYSTGVRFNARISWLHQLEHHRHL